MPSKLAFVLALSCLLGGCMQTDVIARERVAADAASDAASGSSACAAHLCSDFEALGARCNDTASRVAVGDGCAAGSGAGTPAFRFALCSCSDFVSRERVDVSATGGASIAVNGTFTAQGPLELSGGLVAGKRAVLDATQPQHVAEAIVEQAPPACACDEAVLLDVAALVDAHASAPENDNAQLAFDPATLDGFVRAAGAAPLELGCGRYYVASLHGSGTLRMHATGHVALFVAGDLSLDDDLLVELADGAALELFVAGNLRVAGTFSLGDAAAAPRARLYVGGSGTLDFAKDAVIAGALYAPRAELVTRGRFTAYGSIFVRRAAPLGELLVHYDAAQSTPAECTP